MKDVGKYSAFARAGRRSFLRCAHHLERSTVPSLLTLKINVDESCFNYEPSEEMFKNQQDSCTAIQ